MITKNNYEIKANSIEEFTKIQEKVNSLPVSVLKQVTFAHGGAFTKIYIQVIDSYTGILYLPTCTQIIQAPQEWTFHLSKTDMVLYLNNAPQKLRLMFVEKENS